MIQSMDKYLGKASYFMTDSDQLITEAKKEDAAAVVIATEGKKEDFKKVDKSKLGPARILPLKKKAIKEEEDEDVDADTLEEKDEDVEDKDAVCEDEDDGSEDGENDELTEGEEDEGGEGEEEGDEIADDDQIEEPKKKKNVVESYLAHASRWID